MAAGNISYATTTPPDGRGGQVLQGAASPTTIQWKPAPKEAAGEEADDDKDQARQTGSVVGEDRLSAAVQQSQADVNSLARRNNPAKAVPPAPRGSAQARVVRVLDKFGNERLAFVFGKDKYFYVNETDAAAFQGCPEGLLPAHVQYFSDDKPAVWTGGKAYTLLNPVYTPRLRATAPDDQADGNGLTNHNVQAASNVRTSTPRTT